MVEDREAWRAAVYGHSPEQRGHSAPRRCTDVCDSDQRGEQGKTRRGGRGKGSPGPGQLLRGGPGPPDASRLGLWSDPRSPQRDGHCDSRSPRAALGSWSLPGRTKSGGQPCPRTKSAVPASRLESASERHGCGHLARPGVPRGAYFARLWIPAHLSEPWQVWSGTRWRMLLGHTSPSWACCGGGAGLRDGAVVYTRVTRPSAAPRDWQGQHGSFCHNAGDPDPRSWLWRRGRKGLRWAEAAWPWRQGAPRSPVSPGKGEALGGPGSRPPGGMELGGSPAWGPGGPACVGSQGT